MVLQHVQRSAALYERRAGRDENDSMTATVDCAGLLFQSVELVVGVLTRGADSSASDSLSSRTRKHRVTVTLTVFQESPVPGTDD